MKTIFETFKQSIYNPVFYQNAVTAPLSNIARYYIKFSLVLSFLMTISLGILLVPQGVTFIKEHAPEMVRNYFPAELTVHIEKGEASVNVVEPYVIVGKDGAQTILKEQGLENMLVVDTKHDFDKKKFEEYKTFALLTKTEIVTQSDKGQITIQDLRVFPTVTINQEWLLSWVEKVHSNIGYIIFFGLIATFIAMMLGYLKYFVVLLIFALIPLFIAYLKKISLSYGNAYKMSLYAIIPALALKTLINIFGVFSMPAYFTLLVFMLVVAINMQETEQPKLFNN
ncbi:MAG: hypothetical protein A2747_00225 [Candidatus Yonathbacteria bacterium RIFCSPHIGHO2_01_FULL_44_41]|uniref:DUF1189 domain-containing protein n=1 Tax=Candidatus Yonathbacteria bacterium RIFCSPHIGHO2_02_FULL_44_14 TaxID=1802724 RepID=A0A1G2S893_9BACT|nr:MAG: hypothetical protein A2747_00225 [Candidatus Yonathbacteria bacterium RIFCSPHIGHO2_01_FULL_44_41]OHA81175.1 MAG: hypothetical protein A3B06_00290 [Candidatus Yonathbacteria bacterium RIFCSPLOWO2_01_FULL_43_20]OHA81207.1 MAG: hypothetical protein A3D51_01225 [Candidatus Yonathbacteria bacterium RIFCSPHIGHO2_02_FULL_44_14]